MYSTIWAFYKSLQVVHLRESVVITIIIKVSFVNYLVYLDDGDLSVPHLKRAHAYTSELLTRFMIAVCDDKPREVLRV